MDSRTLDQVDHLLRLSRLDPEDFLDIKQVIYFDQNANEVNDNFIVFELPKQMVEAMLLSSQEPLLVLKSENEGAVFACTGTETCSLVEVESSNTVLYTSSLWLPQAKPENAPAETISSSSLFFNPVEFSQNKIIELVPFNGPRLHPLKKLLSPSSFMGHIEDEAEDTDGINLISLNQLRKLTPCSESELQIALKRLNCCHWNGYVRLMEVGYLQNFMRDVFNVIDEHSWDWRKNGVLLDSAIKALDALYPPQLMPHLFRLFCSKYRPRRRFKISGRDTLTPKRLLVAPKHSLDNEEQLSKKICLFPRVSRISRLIAEHLLSVIHRFALDDFISAWRASLPGASHYSVVRPRLHRHLLCRGRAICESLVSTPTSGCGGGAAASATTLSRYFLPTYSSISALASEDLVDSSMEARIRTLFSLKSCWPEAELAGYLEDLVPPPPAKEQYVFIRPRFTDNWECPSSDESTSATSTDIESPASGDEDSTDSKLRSSRSSNRQFKQIVYDQPKPVNPAIGAILGRICRASTIQNGQRVYTEKHAKMF